MKTNIREVEPSTGLDLNLLSRVLAIKFDERMKGIERDYKIAVAVERTVLPEIKK